MLPRYNSTCGHLRRATPRDRLAIEYRIVAQQLLLVFAVVLPAGLILYSARQNCPAPMPFENAEVTRSVYEKINAGMLLADVSRIFDEPGHAIPAGHDLFRDEPVFPAIKIRRKIWRSPRDQNTWIAVSYCPRDPYIQNDDGPPVNYEPRLMRTAKSGF